MGITSTNPSCSLCKSEPLSSLYVNSSIWQLEDEIDKSIEMATKIAKRSKFNNKFYIKNRVQIKQNKQKKRIVKQFKSIYKKKHRRMSKRAY